MKEEGIGVTEAVTVMPRAEYKYCTFLLPADPG